ncbi:MAG: enoyl-CoA hydratase [Rhodobacteraceae bacterium]|nr:enoyl-CoA hydratase [Paracoccaceae bacterium]
MPQDILLRADEGAIATLTLNAPERLNALSLAMLDALARAFADLAADPAIRVVVLRAAGRAFSAGHDLREIQAARAAPDGGAAGFARLFDRCAAVMQAIPALPQPVIAEVQGVATAAGCQLVASCDMAVAADGARFGVNGVNIGLFCATPMVALTRAIAPRAAFEMLVTGEMIDAARARELGLVNRVVPADRLRAETRALAATIAAKRMAAVRIGKEAFHAQAGLPLAEAYRLAGAAMVTNLMRPETAGDIDAFLDRRPARQDP